MSHAQLLRVHDDTDDAVADFAVFCARPSCPKQVLQPAGRGRRRNYCSDSCRQKANTDPPNRHRHTAQAYGRMDDQEADVASTAPVDVTDEGALALASSALANADRILQLVGDRDPILVGALRSLVDDTAPLIRQLQAG